MNKDEKNCKFNIKRIMSVIIVVSLFVSMIVFDDINTNAATGDVIIEHSEGSAGTFQPLDPNYPGAVSTSSDIGQLRFTIEGGADPVINTVVADILGVSLQINGNVVEYSVSGFVFMNLDITLNTGQVVKVLVTTQPLGNLLPRYLVVDGVQTNIAYKEYSANDFGTIEVAQPNGIIEIHRTDGIVNSIIEISVDNDITQNILEIASVPSVVNYRNLSPGVNYMVGITADSFDGDFVVFNLKYSLPSRAIKINGVSTTLVSPMNNTYDFGTIKGGTNGTISVDQVQIVEVNSDLPDNFLLDSSTGIVTYSSLPLDFGPIPISLVFNDGSMAILFLDPSTVSDNNNSSSSSGGGRTEEEEGPNVTNKDNDPNSSNDTTVIPSDVKFDDGKITVELTDEEMEAIIEKVIQNATDNPDGTNEIIIEVEANPIFKIDKVEISLPADFVQDIINSQASAVNLKTKIGSFRVKKDEIARNLEQESGKVDISLEYFEYEGRAGIDAKLQIGETQIKELLTTYGVEIRIPYIPQKDEDINALLIEYIDDTGGIYTITESYFDEQNSEMVFFLTHLSKYGVSYRAMTFSDVPDTHWAEGTLVYLASRGVITGDEDNNFRPNEYITTAEFVTMMTKAFSEAEIGSTPMKSYSDVPLDSWYAKEMAWAYVNNITNVISTDNKIQPNAYISREKVATVTSNIVTGINISLKPSESASAPFNDSNSIASYAKEPVTKMVKYGIISGSPGGSFLPNNSMTRAEAAKVIATLISAIR